MLATQKILHILVKAKRGDTFELPYPSGELLVLLLLKKYVVILDETPRSIRTSLSVEGEALLARYRTGRGSLHNG